MKKIKYFLIALLVLPFSIFLSACSTKPYVTGIEKTKSIGTTDTYTVTYSDGTKSFFTVENGEDGKDATITLDIIKEYCEENNITVEQFFENHLTINTISSQQEVTNQVLNSSVGIWCENHVVSSFGKKQTSLICGSGVIFKMEETYSYVVTNYHVVYSSSDADSNHIASTIHLFQYGTSESVGAAEETSSGYPAYKFPSDAVECTYIGGSMTYDLAILKVRTADLRANNENVKAIKFAEEYRIAESIVAVGNPEGQGIRVTHGYISKESEYTTLKAADEQTDTSFRVMGIDVAVNGGNSGGGVYNSKGELVGIVNAKLMYDSSNNPTENMSYALPIDNVEKVIESILYYYNPITNSNAKPKKLYLGITARTDNYSHHQDEDTGIIYLSDQVVVEEVPTESYGATLGLKAGDIITELKIKHIGEEVKSYKINHAHELYELMLLVRAGDSVTIKYTRNDVPNLDAIILSVSSLNMLEVK